MLTHPTLDQLRALRLDGMAEAFAELQAQDGVDDLPHADWTPEKIRRVAAEIGPGTEALIAAILSERSHPEQGFRSCLGILRLARTHAPERLEAACQRALEIGARSYTSVNSILKTRLDRRRPDPAADGPAISHPNIRGGDYFH